MAFLDKEGLTALWGHITTGLNKKLNKENPVGTGSFSMNRKADTDIGASSFTEGSDCTATGYTSHAEGYATTASNAYAHAEGTESVASGLAAHAEGGKAVASGDYSHAEGVHLIDESGETLQVTVAEGIGAHAEGAGTTASGAASHAEGNQSVANGDGAHAEGAGTAAFGLFSHSEGEGSTASGSASHAEGAYTQATGMVAHAEGYGTIAAALQHASGKYNVSTKAPANVGTQDSSNADAIFMVGCGTAATRKNAFRISSGGKCFGTEAFATSGADFAELFEWSDGNPNNDDRRGLFVALEGEKIRLANAGDDYIGVISGAQAFIGNSASEEWHDKYLTDVFGTKLTQEVEVPAQINEKTGRVIVPAHTATQYVVNPAFNPDEEYVMRENRKEWGIVGMLGQIVMVDDGTCVVGGRVAPSANGVGTASEGGYRVMKRIDENHIKVLVK